MNSTPRRIAGIGLDVTCLAVGYATTFLAIWADHEGTLSDFWFFRLGLATTLVFLAGVVSSLLPREGPMHRVVRFLLFELLTLQLMVEFIVRQGQGPTTLYNSVLPLVVDGLVYWAALHFRPLVERSLARPGGLSR